MSLVTTSGLPSYVDQNASLAGTNSTVFNIPAVADPRISGLAAGLGSTAFTSDGSGNVTAWFRKVSTANTAWEKHDLGSLAWAGTNFGRAMSRAKVLMGTDNITEYFTSFSDNNFKFTNISGNSGIAPYWPGVMYLYHNAAGTSKVTQPNFAATASPPTWPDSAYSASSPWYMSVDYAVFYQDFPLLNTRVEGMGLLDGSNNPYVVGVNGTISSGNTPNFVCTMGGSTTLSTVTCSSDSRFHLLELWNNAAGTFFAVDHETPISVSSVPNTTTYLGLYSTVGAVARQEIGFFSNWFGAFSKLSSA